MSKVSMDFSCPDCQENYDLEIRVPFVATCGHSLCAVCVNEKEVEDCPGCNKEGSFKSKQRNELAIEMLAAMTENMSIDSRRPRLFMTDEAAAAREPIPAILEPKNRPFLAQIVNKLDPRFFAMPKTMYNFCFNTWNVNIPAIQDSKNRSFLTQVVNKLDPRSFAELAMASKTMYNFCFDTREVEIAYDISFIPVRYLYNLLFIGEIDLDSAAHYRTAAADYKIVTYSGNQFGLLGSAENRKKLQKYPFVFRLKKLLFVGELNSVSLASLRSFLDEFPIKSISDVEVMAVTDWEGFVEFLKDFGPRNVIVKPDPDLDYAPIDFNSAPIYRKEAKYLLWNTDNFRCLETVDEEMILGASVKRLHLKCSTISKEAFVVLLKKFANSTEEIRWKLRMQDEFGHFDLFKTLPWMYDGPLPDERPLVFSKNSDSNHKRFRVLRKDGKLLKCYHCGLHTVLSTPEFEDESTCSCTEDSGDEEDDDSDDETDEEADAVVEIGDEEDEDSVETDDEEADEPVEVGNEEVAAPVDL